MSWSISFASLTAEPKYQSRCRRIQFIVLAYARIWRQINLAWPDEQVQTILRNARAYKISLILDTQKGSKDETADARRLRWADFLTSYMHTIDSLDVRCHDTPCCRALSAALETPAPSLRSFKLSLGKLRLDSYRNLFSRAAPKLRSIQLDTSQLWDGDHIKSFPVLSSINVRLCQENCRKTLLSLRTLPQMETLTLVGEFTMKCVPVIERPSILVIPNLCHLTIQKFASPLVQRLVSALRAPRLSSLFIKELMKVTGGTLSPTTMDQALATAVGTRSNPASLVIAIHSNRVVIRTNGTPTYEHISMWNNLDLFLDPGDPHVLDTVTHILTSPSVTVNLRPTHLEIQNSVFQDDLQDDDKEYEVDPARPPKPVTILKVMDFPLLWRRVFEAYPGVKTLNLYGCIEDAVQVISEAEDILPSMTQLSMSHAPPKVGGPLHEDLERIQRARDLVLLFGAPIPCHPGERHEQD